MIGDGITGTAADLVVTPARVESAIHDMDSDAQEDVREALNISFVNLLDVPDLIMASEGDVLQVGRDAADENNILEFGEASGGDASSLLGAELEYFRSTIAGVDTVILREIATDPANQHEVLRYERMVDGDGNVTWDQVMSGNVRAG